MNLDKIDLVNGFMPWISERIKGQPEVLAALNEHLACSELGLTDPLYVKGGFMFVGPTGVGKTEVTLCLTDYFADGNLCKMNMSEFKTTESIMELRARLTKAHMGQCRVFLLDEIEKAHWEAMDLLLGILDKGAELTAADGRLINFTDSYFVMTSNLGAKEAMRSRTNNYTSFKNTVLQYVTLAMRPEIIGRLSKLGGIHVFRRLGEPEQRALAGFHIKRVLERMARHGCHLELSESAFEYIVRNGYSAEYGARNMEGVIMKAIQEAVSTAARVRQQVSGRLIENPDSNGLTIVQVA